MKILLFGKNGQVGWELQRSLAPLGKLILVERDSRDYCGDFENPKGLERTVRAIQPDVIVNAVAYTKVDNAETEIAIAKLINVDSVRTLARVSHDLGILLVHYSTDYVFNGVSDIPWSENDSTSPINSYGFTKCEGEKAILNYTNEYLIFRVSWVYGVHGNNFVKKIIKLAEEKEKIFIVNDQYGIPTGADFIADCTAHSIRKYLLFSENVRGIYHLAASGSTTWYSYARTVVDYICKKGVKIRLVYINPISTSSFPSFARRPLNSCLNASKFMNTFNLILPNWKTGVFRMLDELYDS